MESAGDQDHSIQAGLQRKWSRSNDWFQVDVIGECSLQAMWDMEVHLRRDLYTAAERSLSLANERR